MKNFIPSILARVVLLLFFVFGFFINQFSSERIERFLIVIPYRCPLRLITGWKCAFCGMTHSWIAMFRGEVMTAFHENLFGPILWLGTIFVLVMLSLNKKMHRNLKPALSVLVVVMIVYTIVRNLV